MTERNGTTRLFSLAPLPWTLYPRIGPNDPAFIRDATGKTVVRGIPHDEIAEALVEWANARIEKP